MQPASGRDPWRRLLCFRVGEERRPADGVDRDGRVLRRGFRHYAWLKRCPEPLAVRDPGCA